MCNWEHGGAVLVEVVERARLGSWVLSAVKTFLEYLTDSLSADELINTYRI